MNQFDIPIVLFIFKRQKAVEVMKRIAIVKPKKIYLIADGARNEEEKNDVEQCRRMVENEINWPCQVIKNYAEKNRGVYENIGLGAKWVFEHEEFAIFLEDDNLPETTFFQFCKELLIKYENESKVLWICGTNYLGQYIPKDGSSYMFTKHLLPCGWASWREKFNNFYDGDLLQCSDSRKIRQLKKEYYNSKLYKQYKDCWMSEYRQISNNKKPRSWDYQMDFSIKVNKLYGIAPCNNQIKNIGVDEHSIHGGSTFNNIMTKRFCGMNSYPIEFPLKHPQSIIEDKVFEKRIANILLYPFKMRAKGKIVKIIKKILNISEDKKIKIALNERYERRKK